MKRVVPAYMVVLAASKNLLSQLSHCIKDAPLIICKQNLQHKIQWAVYACVYTGCIIPFNLVYWKKTQLQIEWVNIYNLCFCLHRMYYPIQSCLTAEKSTTDWMDESTQIPRICYQSKALCKNRFRWVCKNVRYATEGLHPVWLS